MKLFQFISICLFFCCFSWTIPAKAQQKAAFTIFDSKGKKVKYSKVIRSLKSADIALFGEYHNNPICHWLQYELVYDLDSTALIVGAEMFERDNEEALAQYLSGAIDSSGLDTLVRLWSNYETDYKPVVNLAKDRGIPFVSTNIPRRFASMVYYDGFEILNDLSEEEKSWIAPLPIAYDPDLPGYKKMLDMIPGHGGENFPKAQAIKDATMAHFILENWREGKLFFHLNGTYHSDNYEGIVWYLKQKKPNLSYVTISTIEQKDISKLKEKHLNKADFIIAIPTSMTKTY